MIRTVFRMLIASVLTCVLSSCAWYQAMGFPTDNRAAHIEDNSMRDQDPNMKRFYELQRRIEALESKLDPVEPVEKASNNRFYKINKQVEYSIARIRERAQASINAIDQFISGLQAIDDSGKRPSEPTIQTKERTGELSSIKSRAGVAGTLVRNEQGKVVKSTNKGNRYNYSVVYTYLEPEPWNDMWAILGNQGVVDKWRGQNNDRKNYFIYVGAYYTSKPAEKRQKNLLSLTGAMPDIRVREGYQIATN